MGKMQKTDRRRVTWNWGSPGRKEVAGLIRAARATCLWGVREGMDSPPRLTRRSSVSECGRLTTEVVPLRMGSSEGRETQGGARCPEATRGLEGRAAAGAFSEGGNSTSGSAVKRPGASCTPGKCPWTEPEQESGPALPSKSSQRKWGSS